MYSYLSPMCTPKLPRAKGGGEIGRARAPCLVSPCLVIPPGERRRPAVYNDWRAHSHPRAAESLGAAAAVVHVQSLVHVLSHVRDFVEWDRVDVPRSRSNRGHSPAGADFHIHLRRGVICKTHASRDGLPERGKVR